MNAPTNRALLKWWDRVEKALPSNSVLVCHGCGRADTRAYVQPQHPFWSHVEGVTTIGEDGLVREGNIIRAMCGDCIGTENKRRDAERKAELAAMARCEVPDCGLRGTVQLCQVALLCGRHAKKVRHAHDRNMAKAGGLGLFLPGPRYTKDNLVAMATTKEKP